MTEQTVTEQTVVAKPNYSALQVSVMGTREGVTVNAYTNVLTAEQKIDRDLLFRVGRKLPLKDLDYASARLYVAGQNDYVFEMSAFVQSNGKWQVSAENNGVSERFDEEMSETKRPSKTKTEIDPGPALLKLITAVLKRYSIGIVQIAAESGPRVSQTDTQIATLNTAIASAESLKTGNETTDAVIEALIGTLKGQVATLTQKQDNAKKAREARRTSAASTVAVPASPLGEAAGNAAVEVPAKGKGKSGK
jgi:hypothetical protein